MSRALVSRALLGALAAATTLFGALAWGFVAPAMLREDAVLGPLSFAACALVIAYALRKLPQRRAAWPWLTLAALATPIVALLDVTLFAHLEIPARPPALAAETYCNAVASTAPGCRHAAGLAARALPGAHALGASTIPLYLVNHGMHTGLAVAAADLDVSAWPQARELAAAGYLELGWGDAAYFQADDPTVLMGIGAFVIPGPSVLHVATFAAPPPQRFAHDEVLTFAVPRERVEALQRFLQSSFALDASGAVVTTSKGDYGPGSSFVQATGLYYFPNTCNVWTARGLAAAGVPVVPEVAISTRNLMYQARRFAQSREETSP